MNRAVELRHGTDGDVVAVPGKRFPANLEGLREAARELEIEFSERFGLSGEARGELRAMLIDLAYAAYLAGWRQENRYWREKK